MYSRNEILRAGARAMWDAQDPQGEPSFDSLSERSRVELMLSFGNALDAIWPLLQTNIQERWDEEICKVDFSGVWNSGS